MLYNSDVLLYDRATQSLWSQLLQSAISGPLKGTRLESVPLTHTTWADWQRRHPTTEVLSTDTGFGRLGEVWVPRLMTGPESLHDAPSIYIELARAVLQVGLATLDCLASDSDHYRDAVQAL